MLCTVMTITTDGCLFIGLYLVKLFVIQSDFTVRSDAHKYCSFVMLQRNGGGVLTQSVKRNLIFNHPQKICSKYNSVLLTRS